MTFRHKCEASGCWIARHAWDWEILSGCFGDTRIEPTDLDCNLIERYGNFLLIETKGPAESGIPTGQHITYTNAARLKQFTIMVVYGPRNQPERITTFYPNGHVTTNEPTNRDDFRFRVQQWFKYATNNPDPLLGL